MDRSIIGNYILGDTIGKGAFSTVKVAKDIRTGRKVAIKNLNLHKLDSKMKEYVDIEIIIGKVLKHQNIVQLYEVIETPSDIYLVMEYVDSGELFEYIEQKNGNRIPENEARKFFQQIIFGVEHCHNNMVVHRDLKLENILLDSRGNIKIADFGLSAIMQNGNLLTMKCGSPHYVAPEVIFATYYGPEVDIWSCGIILYVLLCGCFPFDADNENPTLLYKKIKDGIYFFPNHISPGAKDLISRMLVVDPARRIIIPQIRQHYWFQDPPHHLAVPLSNIVPQADAT